MEKDRGADEAITVVVGTKTLRSIFVYLLQQRWEGDRSKKEN